MSARKILLISYFFPPVGGVGVQRALSMARYLPDNDLELHVLTAYNPSAPVYDEQLLRLIPENVTVHKAITLEPPFYLRKKIWEAVSGSRKVKSPSTAGPAPAVKGSSLRSRLLAVPKRLLCPDPQVLWTPFAIRRAKEVVRRCGIDVVLATAPPFSVFCISNALKKEFPRLKVVSDFRDEWLRFYLTDFEFLRDEYTVRRAAAIERETVEGSDLVVAVSRTSLDEIRSRYPGLPESRFAWVPNGYDPAAFARIEPRRHGKPGRMVVTHTGTAYSTASPRFYLDALDQLPEEIRSSIETRFIGRVTETEDGTFANRKSLVKLLGFRPQAEALQLTAETDYLLLTMVNDFSLPGKMFEYLALRKPILAFSPAGGEVDRLIAETRSGWCVPHDDPAAIRSLLIRSWERLREGKVEFEPDGTAIARYERARLAARMAELLKTI